MNFIEAAAHARGGVGIRCLGWATGVVLRWQWIRMKWEGCSDYRQPDHKWIDVPNHPNPTDIQRDDWEVVQLA